MLMDIVFWTTYLISLYIAVFVLLILIENGNSPKTRNIRKFPFVSIIIPAYNEEKTIKETIKSALALDYPKNRLELIVVNDGSSDRTEEAIHSIKDKRLKLITQKNYGKGSALNRGLKIAKGKFVACLDADSIVERNVLKKMLGYFTDEKVAAVAPLMKVRSPEKFVQKLQWLEYTLYIFLRMLLSSVNSIHVTPGPFSIYRASALKDVGGFDEESIVEDQEIAYRFQSRHYKIRQSREGNVLTIAPGNFNELYKQRKRWFKGSILTIHKYRRMLFNKEYGDFGLFQLPTLVIGVLTPFVVLSFVILYIVRPFLTWLYHLYLVNFDISVVLQNMASFSTLSYLIGWDYGKIFIIGIMLLISISLLIWAHSHTREKIQRGLIPLLVVFFAVYYIMLSFMWLGSMTELVIEKKRKW